MAYQKHAITAAAVTNMIFDAGVVYMNHVNETNPGTILGVTRGGSEFSSGIEMREIEVDGAPGPLKGYKRIIRVAPTLTVNLLEMSKENWLIAMAGGVQAAVSGLTGFDEINLKQITNSSYLSNITFVGTMQDGHRAIIQLDNALADGDFSISFADQDEANPAVTFGAHFDPIELEGGSDPFDHIPLHIWIENPPLPPPGP